MAQVNMENVVSTMQALSLKSSTSLPGSGSSRLRKRYITGKKASLPFGIDVRRLSDHESFSPMTRGTLGGFTSLSDLGRADSDGSSLEKEKAREKECCLTTLTKKIGLGVYRHAHRMPSPCRTFEEKGTWDEDEDERETWYMLYPPPPSPSLAVELPEWDSASSSLDSRPESMLRRDSSGQETDDEPHAERASTRESLYGSVHSDDLTPNIIIPTTDSQGIDEEALSTSIENLAQQYRDVLPPSPGAGPFSVPASARAPEPQLVFELLVPVATPPAKTIRKVKGQQGLRRMVDLGSPCSASPVLPLSSSLEAIISPTESRVTVKHKRQRSQPPSPPPRESSLSFITSSDYSYSPGHGPRRTHGRKSAKQLPAQPPCPLGEFKFQSPMEIPEPSYGVPFPQQFFYPYHPSTYSTDTLHDLYPQPLNLRRPGTGMKKSSPPPDPVLWDIPPVPLVPATMVSRPAEGTPSESVVRPRVPLRGGVGGDDGVMNPFDMTRLRDVEGGWI